MNAKRIIVGRAVKRRNKMLLFLDRRISKPEEQAIESMNRSLSQPQLKDRGKISLLSLIQILNRCLKTIFCQTLKIDMLPTMSKLVQ